ncbi:CDP-glycerol glycerophosphotransferase family protein [Lentibacillus sp. N15]
MFYKICFRAVYTFFCLVRKTDSNKMIIALYRTDHLDDNLRLIYEEVRRQEPDIKIHLVQGVNKMNLKLFKEIIALADARYLILDDYYLPVYLVKQRKSLKVIQLWHAAGALKKFGHSTVGTKFGPSQSYINLVPVHSNYNFVYISAKKFVKYYAEAFYMDPNRIFALGIPRTDLLTDEKHTTKIRNNMYSTYPFLKNKDIVNILMAPTYRANGSYLESQLDVVKSIMHLSRLVGSNRRIIFKAHPYMDPSSVEKLKNCSNVFVAERQGINEWMLVADAFITDYSSSIFEFALLEKPMAHFVPDLAEYKNNRGFYAEMEEMSDAAIIQDLPKLSAWINVRKTNEYFDSNRMIAYNFDHIDNVTARIVRHFLSTDK